MEFELSVNETDAKEVTDYFEQNGLHGIGDLLEKKRNEWIDIHIHVAISGSKDAGKSSFINLIRSLKAEDKNGAALNVGTTTIEPIPYSHPNKHYLKFWDLPQLGTPAFSRDLYLKNVNFNRYDLFLIFTKSEFTEDDYWFAEQMQLANKKFFFVRTHTDVALQEAMPKNDSKLDPIVVQNKLVTAIRDKLIRSVKEANIKTDTVYCITTSDNRKYDFPALATRMILDLPDRKWEAMALTINVLAQDVIAQKRRALQKRVWIIAIMSGLESACHIYGLPYHLDVDAVIAEVQEYRKQFGLDEGAILRFARSIDTTVESLKKASSFKTNYSQLADGGLLNIYKTIYYNIAEGILQSFSPVLGSLITGNLAFGSTYHVLNKLMDMMETDAIRMMEFVEYRKGGL